MTEKELLHVMQNVDGKYSDEVQARISAAQKPVYRRVLPGLLAAGAAACVALTVITALPKQNEKMSVASTDLRDEVAEVQAPESEADEAAAKEQISAGKQAAEAKAKPESKTGKAASEPKAAAEAKASAAEKPEPKAAESAAPEAKAEQPAAQQAQAAQSGNQQPAAVTADTPAAASPVFGDFDLDGQFTLADGVLCDMIYFAELNDVLDMIPLTDAQLRQADIIPGCTYDSNSAYPLGRDEEQAILHTLRLIYSYDLTGITPPDYLANQNYYDDYTLYRSPRLVRELPIDWASIGLTGDFTEDDFWRVVSPEYALERYEEENGPLPADNDQIGDFLNAVRVTQSKYAEMIGELMKREGDKWEDPIYDFGIAIERCRSYAVKLHRQKFGEPGYAPAFAEPADPRLIFTDEDLTWDAMLKVFEEAKTYTVFGAPDFRL